MMSIACKQFEIDSEAKTKIKNIADDCKPMMEVDRRNNVCITPMSKIFFLDKLTNFQNKWYTLTTLHLYQ